MRKQLLIVFSALLFCVSSLFAQEKLKMQFNFEAVSGTTVSDPISGISAKLVNNAKVVAMGNRQVLNLGTSNGYLDMTKSAGEIIKGLTNYTVSVYYRVGNKASLSGAGYFLWCFSRSAANTQTSSGYAGYRLNAQCMAASTSGWGSEKNAQIGTASAQGRWVHMLYRQKGQSGELFVDGKKMATVTDMPAVKDIFTVAPAYNWIGRAPFESDNYLQKTLVSDFRLYDGALADDEVKSLAKETTALDHEYNFGASGDLTTMRSYMKDCEEFLAGDTKTCAPNAMAELNDAMKIAKNILQTGKGSQFLIDDYANALRMAYNNAKRSANYNAMNVFTPSADYGFAHPGGIVSQEDIDRAKQLLAAGDERITRAWQILCNNGYSHADVATWPTETVIRGGGSGQNYMNCARGAAMAYQNALRWKIGGTKENADAAVRIMMAWVNGCKGLGGDTNVSLAAGIYGHEFANAAELMRDYEGWSREDFAKFKQWIIKVFYNPAIDFLRRRHDTWLNARYASLGERPGHYWSNWGLCNALCVMSIGILCDDVHMYNQGVSFYKYDHVGTFKDRSKNNVILNDGCNEFIGNLVPVLLPDDRGPFGYLGQMQESGRDQGHALMALGLALDICQVGLTQGDDLFAYMNDRIAAGAEHVAAVNFGGVDAATLPWITYNYADCRGTMGAGWAQGGVNTGGMGEYRPYWDRAIGYYEGLRGVKMQYSEMASAKVCPDGGGGNYSQNSGGFDALGFSTLTSWRPAVTVEQAITPLSGDIIYKGETLTNQTNLGGLKYNYVSGKSNAIPADGSDITLIPQLPEGATDSGNWIWNTGETTRQITVKADHSYIYRVTYTAPNGAVSRQAFAIAVSGDAVPDVMSTDITVDGEKENVTEKTVLEGTSVTLHVGAITGWMNGYLWDNNNKTNTVTVPSLLESRTYLCQYANQSGAVSESRFVLNVVPAIQYINGAMANEIQLLSGANVTLKLEIPTFADPENVVWSDGVKGNTREIENVQQSMTLTASYEGKDYVFTINLKQVSGYSYYSILTADKGYSLVTSVEDFNNWASDHYFVLASDDADLLIGLKDAPKNGNKALFFQTPVNPVEDLSKVFMVENYNGGITMRNVDYDGLTLQTEWDRPDQLRTHDQPLACEWSRLLPAFDNGSWTIENGKYAGNWLGLWTPANGYNDGEEIACNKKDADIAHLQIFAIERDRFYQDYLAGATAEQPVDATPLIVNPEFIGNGMGWTMTGQWGNQRYNGAVEVWHSTNFKYSQVLSGLPDGEYTVTCQMANGEGSNTAYLYATSDEETQKDVVSQSCAGSDFNTQRDLMAGNAKYGLLSVDVNVKGGSLEIGIIEPSAGNTWIVWDNFTLTYRGIGSTGVKEVNATIYNKVNNAIYDLSGRRVTTMKKGVYIVNGKKTIVK